ncbi:MAG TPA: GGDEF domain-containing protein [Candidatus Polarisedimenticolia bacterium]|nr:GGDEF domain-containing protein [Candidatus Polarisedimenticolia bacterium]
MSKTAFDETKAGERPALEARDVPRSNASLIVLQGAEIGRDFRLRRGPMLIGRGFEADIRVPDDLASREHARIECSYDSESRRITFHLVDLQSTNHTFVNWRPIERMALHDGDKIQVGETILKFVLLDDIEAKFHSEVRNRITFDRLSGLLTKESLFLALEMELNRCTLYQLPLAVLMMDLDCFKKVNDAHGHLVGSRVIGEVGQVIRETVRGADVAARYGGEEFLAYFPENGRSGAHQAAERLRRAVGCHLFAADGPGVRITMSIGVALFPDHGRTVEALVGRADGELYRAKESGRDRVCLCPEEW